MGFLELFILALGLSMDAFAVSVCLGLKMKASWKNASVTGLYFGLFQAVMPLAGYGAARLFADKIVEFDHYIAFALLSFLGVKMILGSLKKEKCPDRACPEGKCTDRECPSAERVEFSLAPAKMLPFALATSIDALAVGVSFAFLGVDIVPAVSFIGVTTFALCVAGVKIGAAFGMKIKSKAEIFGGAVLILIGLKILLEHLGVIGF